MSILQGVAVAKKFEKIRKKRKKRIYFIEI